MNCGIASVVITWVRYGVATIIAAADGVTAEADTTVSQTLAASVLALVTPPTVVD